MDVISKTTNAHLFIMASLSPMVANTIEQELYRTNVELDESTENHILENAFYNFIKDIETIGLSFDIDPSDYIEDPHALSDFLQCAELLLPNGLYPLMKKESGIRTLIKDILQGSIGDGSCTVKVYLSEVAALDGGIPHKPHLVEAIDRLYTKISQTGVFTDYLRNLTEMLDQEKMTQGLDTDRQQMYQMEMRHVIGSLSDVVNLFEDDADYSELTRIQSFIIKDFLSPDNYLEYSYILLEKEHTIPEELVERYRDKWVQYHASHPWCYSYYTVRHINTISRPFQIIIAAMTYALAQTRDVYDSKMKAFREKYRDDHVDQQITSLFMLKD